VRKLAGAQQQLGSLTETAAATGPAAAAVAWDESTWCKLFALLADNPPRDLQPGDVSFLRSLPMFRRLKVQQHVAEEAPQQQQQQEDAEGWLQDDALLADGGGAAAAAEQGQLVALGEGSSWVLAPQAVVQECQGEVLCSKLNCCLVLFVEQSLVCCF
jgi:hypothetical protein